MPGNFLSGAAARLLVAALTHQDETPRSLGQIAGIPRYQTVREAARELVEAGYTDAALHPTPRLLDLLLHLFPLAQSYRWPSANDSDDGNREINEEIDSNTIYRHVLSAPTEGSSTKPEQARDHTYDEQKVFASPPQTESVHPQTESVQVKQKVFTGRTESVQGEQKVFNGQTESVHPGILVGRSGSEDGEEVKQAHKGFEDSFAALVAADAMPRVAYSFPVPPAYRERVQAQMGALRAFWSETLPGMNVTDQSLGMLLRTAGGEAERVANLIVTCAEKGIERPVAYITAALKRMATEDEAKRPREQNWDLELAPMTPEFAAQLDETRRQAALLWPEG